MIEKLKQNIKNAMPEMLILLLLPIAIQIAVDIFPNKRTALIVIPIMCILYLLIKREALINEPD